MSEQDQGHGRKPKEQRHTSAAHEPAKSTAKAHDGKSHETKAHDTKAHATREHATHEDVTPQGADPTSGTAARRGPQPVAARRERYLVAPLPAGVTPQGFQPFAAGPAVSGLFGNLSAFGAAPTSPPVDPQRFLDALHADPTVTVQRVLKKTATPAGSDVGAFGAGPGVYGFFGPTQSTVEFPEVAVVEMEPDRAATFAAEPTVHVEPDLALRYGADTPGGGLSVADPGLVPFGTDIEVDFVVRASDNSPVPDAEIYIMSASFPARGVTGPDGKATLATSSTAIDDVTAVYVKPAGDFWTAWLAKPQLLTTQPNLVTCRRLSDSFPGFPQKELEEWGKKAMNFDAVPPTFRGHGIKVAIIDSGAAMTHPDLAGRVVAGRDVADQNDTGWTDDTVGHGSHCAGIIGGKDNGSGILGIVPEADMYSCKIFPGGRFSDLIEALDYCIENQIDVVNLSLGTPDPSELVRLKVEQARQAGVACVVAAGNSANAVSFPASMSSVLAVAAIGKLGEYPPDSYHATQTSGIPTAEGYFSAKFTCFGPEVDVCAPGVAIVSSVPPDLFAAEDGTSFAGPHVTGLAAMVLAHHPDFRLPQYAQRGPGRVDHLFDIIRSSCRPMNFGDPGRSGAGLPDAARALGAIPGAAMAGMPGVPGMVPAGVPGWAGMPPWGGAQGYPAPIPGYPAPFPGWGPVPGFGAVPGAGLPGAPGFAYPPPWGGPGFGAPQGFPGFPGVPGVAPAAAGPELAPASAGPVISGTAQPTGATHATQHAHAAQPAHPRAAAHTAAPDPLEPLRAAMRAAGLEPTEPHASDDPVRGARGSSAHSGHNGHAAERHSGPHH